MLNIFDYITNYCNVHDIKQYSYKSKVITLDDINNAFTFAPGIAFFYKMHAVGEIHNIENINKDFLIVQTPTDLWDFSKIGIIRDDGALQHIESDFIFVADNTMNINLKTGANCLFNDISSLQMYYIYVSVLSNETTKAANNSKIYDITINR